MDEETEAKHFWDKKQDELTVGDNLKIAGGVMVIATALPLVMVAGAVGVANLVEKFRERRAVKKLNNSVG